MSKKEQFLKSLAESVLECPVEALVDDWALSPWDSLAIVSTIALVDEVYGVLISGRQLADCVTVADLLKLVPND